MSTEGSTVPGTLGVNNRHLSDEGLSLRRVRIFWFSHHLLKSTLSHNYFKEKHLKAQLQCFHIILYWLLLSFIFFHSFIQHAYSMYIHEKLKVVSWGRSTMVTIRIRRNARIYGTGFTGKGKTRSYKVSYSAPWFVKYQICFNICYFIVQERITTSRSNEDGFTGSCRRMRSGFVRRNRTRKRVLLLPIYFSLVYYFSKRKLEKNIW